VDLEIPKVTLVIKKQTGVLLRRLSNWLQINEIACSAWIHGTQQVEKHFPEMKKCQFGCAARALESPCVRQQKKNQPLVKKKIFELEWCVYVRGQWSVERFSNGQILLCASLAQQKGSTLGTREKIFFWHQITFLECPAARSLCAKCIVDSREAQVDFCVRAWHKETPASFSF
jgi:hypothetical protein